MNGMRRPVANKKVRSKPIEKPDLTFWYERERSMGSMCWPMNEADSRGALNHEGHDEHKGNTTWTRHSESTSLFGEGLLTPPRFTTEGLLPVRTNYRPGDLRSRERRGRETLAEQGSPALGVRSGSMLRGEGLCSGLASSLRWCFLPRFRSPGPRRRASSRRWTRCGLRRPRRRVRRAWWTGGSARRSGSGSGPMRRARSLPVTSTASRSGTAPRDSLTDKRHWANREVCWVDLLRQGLKDAYRSDVTIVNPAIGGTQLRQNVILIPRWQPSPSRIWSRSFSEGTTGTPGCVVQSSAAPAPTR